MCKKHIWCRRCGSIWEMEISTYNCHSISYHKLHKITVVYNINLWCDFLYLLKNHPLLAVSGFIHKLGKQVSVFQLFAYWKRKGYRKVSMKTEVFANGILAYMGFLLLLLFFRGFFLSGPISKRHWATTTSARHLLVFTIENSLDIICSKLWERDDCSIL